MGKITLFVFILLVLMGGALEGKETVTSGVHPTETSPNTVATPDSPAPATGSDRVTTPEPKLPMFPPGGTTTSKFTTADHHQEVEREVVGAVFAFYLMGVIACFCCCSYTVKVLDRIRLPRGIANWATSVFLDEDNDAPPADMGGDGEASHNNNPSEDAVSLQGLSSGNWNWKLPVVKFRRAKPDSEKESLLSSPGDVLDI